MTSLQSVAFRDPIQQRILALSGMAQAARLVHEVANTGQLDEAKSIVCWQSLFVTDPEHISDIYGGNECLQNLRMGLETLLAITQQDQTAPVAELTRYIIGILHLQTKLSKSPGQLSTVAQQLERSAQQIELYGIEHANVTASLGEIYTSNLSHYRFRIQVTGNPIYLQQAANANRVRSLLLSGIRSAILWRQVGGRRWQFLFGKQKLEQQLKTLLNLSHQ